MCLLPLIIIRLLVIDSGPPDAVLGPALHDYARKSLSLSQHLDYLLKDFGYKIKNSIEYGVPTVKKPPPDHHVSWRSNAEQCPISQGSPKFLSRMEQKFPDIDPDGAEARFPGRRHQTKQRGHLTDTGVYYELHFDGHEKLNFKALRMGPVGINIYGSRCHASSKMVKFLALMLAVLQRLDTTISIWSRRMVFSSKPRWMVGRKPVNCMQHILLCVNIVCQISRLWMHQPFVALKSTDNITIESSWNLFTNYIGLSIKQILLLGKSLNYFNPGFQHHIQVQ
ncbi:hypothetical protein DFH07DRAFT_766894 [Mycena maculata]|uniref:Uncharacterized protein n=1 Tax=Mycena maculata TaxID=230809 RepID=A0AAD7K0Q7_9AGAR|nr:hypothetical protein DFH07DRAFT_766894 [Mycena maculata]